MRNSTVSQ